MIDKPGATTLLPVCPVAMGVRRHSMLMLRTNATKPYTGCPPVRARGVKSRMCPPYPQRDRKRRLNGAVSESPYKKGGPVSVFARAR